MHSSIEYTSAWQPVFDLCKLIIIFGLWFDSEDHSEIMVLFMFQSYFGTGWLVRCVCSQQSLQKVANQSLRFFHASIPLNMQPQSINTSNYLNLSDNVVSHHLILWHSLPLLKMLIHSESTRNHYSSIPTHNLYLLNHIRPASTLPTFVQSDA